MFSSVGRSPAPPRTAAQRRGNTSSTRSRLSAGTLRSERRKSGSMSTFGPTSTSMTLQQSRPRSMGTAGSASSLPARGLASRGSVHDLGATQSLAGSMPSAGSLSSLSLSSAGKSVWRLPPVSHQASTASTPQLGPQPSQQTGELVIRSHAANIPHPAKMATGGEDASFTTQYALGVADGVGGWSAHGIDAGEYARGLMSAAKEAVEVHGYSDPLAVLWHAYRDVTSLGSSTCLIIVLDEKRAMLHSANLGDSGFRLIRNGAIIHRAKLGQHYFNCPYQLGSHSSDLPSDACRHSMAVQAGDLIVSGSDGLFDNLFDADILAIANDSDDVKEIATKIANAARQASGNSLRQGPFALEAIANGIQFQGGKFDDVTVVASRIECNSAEPPATSSAPEQREHAPASRGMASGSGPAACKFLQSGAQKGAAAKKGTALNYRDLTADRDTDSS